MSKALALTVDGRITYCVAPIDRRGMGRCNHVEHQSETESSNEFIMRVSNKVSVDDNSMADQTDGIKNLVSQYGRIDNPNWENIIRSIENPFNIGSKNDETYEEAEMVDFEEEYYETGNGKMIRLTAYYKFRGVIYKCDFGEVPAVNEDGTIDLDGVSWRVLPVLAQNKAGVVSYFRTIVVKKDDFNVAFSMSKDKDDKMVKINGVEVPVDHVNNFLRNGETKGLNTGQIYALKDIDPIVFERFPNLAADGVESLKDLDPDEPGDIEHRRVFRYEDIVHFHIRTQLRRMGNTFRGNLGKRTKAEGLSEEEMNTKFPLFYQTRLSENIKSDLVGRSNVQYADNLNPIAALSQSQKISLTGPGGYNKDKAPYDLRMPHNSHLGIIDPMDISSGKNIGLTSTVSTGFIGDDRLIRKKPESEKSLSPSDFIPYRKHNDPNRAIMAVAHMKQACPILGGEDPIIKTDAWNHVSGSKLGVNLKIAYIPGEGVFEDAVVISQSAASKMATIQSQTYNTKDVGSLKVGDRVERKDSYGSAEIRFGGVVTNITDNGFEVETVYKMTPGDKLAGRHGNKSVVSKVLPDNEMPYIVNPDNTRTRAQILMSPLSVAGRKNLGQVMETNEAFDGDNNINKTRRVILDSGREIEATAGTQYIMRLNHIAEKKLSSYADELDIKRESKSARLGEMESILLSSNEERLQILDYLRHQTSYDSHNKLRNLLKSVGVNIKGVNWER